ncbi:MAG: glycosyltransferase [Fibrobacteraceae bacterium]|nr:glycosyltransferase [Fibrobacteraceae bacterium]
MIENVRHIGPALYVQGGISSVLVSYKKLFGIPESNFIASYNGSFVKSLPVLFFVCLKLLLCPEKNVACYQIHTSFNGSFLRKFIISLCLRFRGKKYIAHIHGSLFKEFCCKAPNILKCCIRSYFLHSQMVICITPDMREFMDEFVGKGRCRFVVVPNPCQTIAEKPIDLASHEKPVKIVFSGRFGHRKGVYDLIQAFSLAEFNVPVEMYLFGDGEFDKVRSVAEASSRKEKIHVSGWLTHGEYLKRLVEFDLLVLPSYAETFGMSLVEAMGLGIPVISTFSGGVPYVVENGQDGFLIDAGDVQSLAEKLKILADDDSLRIEMGKTAWKSCKTKFTGDVVLNLLEEYYQKMDG